jgi:hypothetical protein
MRLRYETLILLLAFLQLLLLLSGCTPAHRKMDDAKQYFLDDIMRW